MWCGFVSWLGRHQRGCCARPYQQKSRVVEMLDEIGVVQVRSFPRTKMMLGVGRDDGSYYVYDRPFAASGWDWHMHCGPYATFQQAADWIRDIREVGASPGASPRDEK